MSILNKLIVLKLNVLWQPVGYATVQKSIVDLSSDETDVQALNIEYGISEGGEPNFDEPTSMYAVDWEEWITLPIRPWDLTLRSPSIEVRVPTVLIAKNFKEMPWVRFGGKPSLNQIWNRDGGVDQYTGKKLHPDEASVDHVIPRYLGGRNTWENEVLTHKMTNWKKGHRTNEEMGLRLIRKPKAPPPVPISATIKEARHPDWVHFLVAK